MARDEKVVKRSVIQGVFLLVALFLYSAIYADGMIVPALRDRHLHMTEPSQKAVIFWDGNKQTLLLAAAVTSNDISNFAWVIPIQSRSKPEVSAGDIQVFEDLVDYFGRPTTKPGQLGDSRTEGAGLGVTVIETKEVDIYDIAILKAQDPKELRQWLNSHGYGVPDNAEAVLEQYTRREDTYFVANRIDLKNRYSKEIDEAKRILDEAEQRYDRLCGEINTVLRFYGIEEICREHRYHKESETLAVIQDAIHDPGNPLRLPRKWLTSLGDGLKVEELCTATPRFVRAADHATEKMIEFDRLDDKRWSLALIRDDSFVDVIDYLPYRKTGLPPRYLSNTEAISRLTRSKRVSRQDVSLLRRYLARRQTYHAVTEDDGQCSSRLGVLAKELSDRLARSVWEQFGLNRNLYGGSRPLRDKSGTRGDPAIAEIVSGVYGQLAKGQQRQGLRALHQTLIELKKGIATPLKFAFTPTLPNYPLLISSLNAGRTHIEVYFVGEHLVADDNGVLTVDASKPVGPRLQRKLSRHIDAATMDQVTRLVYRGPLEALKADAVFRSAVVPQTGLGPVSSDTASQDKRLWREKIRVANSKDTPAEVLGLLARDLDVSVRMRVADNPATPSLTLSVLAADTHKGVRHRVAGNPNTPPDILTGLAGDDFGEIKFALLSNPNAPGETVGGFAASTDPKLRLMVARHPNTPTVVLQRLAADADPKVTEAARKALRPQEDVDTTTGGGS